MAPIEAMLLRKTRAKNPPIFIIGPPRSGTSLLYEVMITRFYFTYMSNASHRLFKTPVTAALLFRSLIQKWRGDFTSHYGHIDGWGAPNEGGWIWQRWMNDGAWRDGAGFSNGDSDAVRKMVAGFESIGGAPFLNKNVMHSNRLQLMSKIWPDALYIEVKRDFAVNARSIIRAQSKQGNSNEDWWSVQPKIAQHYIGKDVVGRSVAQVVGVAQDIESDKKIIGPAKFMDVPYDELCDNPNEILDQIKNFLASHGVDIMIKNEIPNDFSISPSRLLSDAQEEQLQSHLAILL